MPKLYLYWTNLGNVYCHQKLSNHLDSCRWMIQQYWCKFVGRVPLLHSKCIHWCLNKKHSTYKDIIFILLCTQQSLWVFNISGIDFNCCVYTHQCNLCHWKTLYNQASSCSSMNRLYLCKFAGKVPVLHLKRTHWYLNEMYSMVTTAIQYMYIVSIYIHNVALSVCLTCAIWQRPVTTTCNTVIVILSSHFSVAVRITLCNTCRGISSIIIQQVVLY